ncbi:DUF1259 domain-containing protein [Nitrospira sp. Nam74]
MAYLMTFRRLVVAFVLLIGIDRVHADSGLNTSAIDAAMGTAGQAQGDLYKISLPRTDLSVFVDDVRLKPRFALGSWIAFKARGDAAVAHGDLVLVGDEVGPVIRRLEQDDITVTALHNHLIRESPKVMYLHFWAEGDAEQVAINLRRALTLTKTPIGKPNRAENSEVKNEEDLPAHRIQEVLGEKGTVKDGVLSIAVPRKETITMHNLELPPSMGMATAINLQGGGPGKVAATGDFVLAAPEVSRVTSALTRHGIQVTALHNHLVHSSPDLYFMHFWAHDAPDRIARGLRAGLDAMNGTP